VGDPTFIESLIICAFCFAVCFYCGLRARWAGFLATMAVGYFFGIVRANLETSLAHFFYDFGASGYYLSLLITRKSQIQRYKLSRIMPWIVALTAWPSLLLLAPTQIFMVQLVGLRAQIFFLPFLAVGAMIDNRDARRIAYGLAVLNAIALVFALLEVQFGVPKFFPFNAVDQIIYHSTDVLIGGIATYRIPSIFENSAGYGMNMAASLPLLIGLMMQERRPMLRNLLYAAIAASAIGVFLSASRTSAIFLAAIVLGVLTAGHLRRMPKFGWLVLVAFLVMLVGTSSRMQRFLSLEDSRYVKNRVHSSVNETFMQLVAEYPMGNGLGGGGTSMPYFLASQVRHQVSIEDDYGRILLEEGLPGLALWLALFIWTITRPLPRKNEQWYVGRWLARIALAYELLTGVIGTGLLTAIPNTAMVLFYVGWITAPNVIEMKRPVPQHSANATGQLRTA
jgi:hypothetical protein